MSCQPSEIFLEGIQVLILLNDNDIATSIKKHTDGKKQMYNTSEHLLHDI